MLLANCDYMCGLDMETKHCNQVPMSVQLSGQNMMNAAASNPALLSV